MTTARRRAARPVFAEAWALLLALALAAPFGTARPAGAQEGGARWTLLAPQGEAPAARWDHTLAADAAGGRLVLFGGRDGDGAPLGDTWSYDFEEETWSASEGPAPSPRFGHTVAVDEAARALYLFGGQADGATFFDDAWRLDLETGGWAELDTGGGPRPPARYGTSAVLDGAGNLLVSHGFTFDGRFDDTWALDLASGAWTEVSPAAGETRPLRRCLHEAVWDEAGGRMLLFGGCSSGSGPCPQGDLWAFDPEARSWTELTSQPAPPARANPALVVDPSNGRALLLAGLTEAGYAADLWELPLGDADPGPWREVAVAGEAPAPRSSLDAAVTGDRLYLFGGTGDGATFADLWALDLGG